MSSASRAFNRKSDFDAAIQQALVAAAAYYDGTDLLMTDADYDSLIARIEVSVTQNPSWDAAGLLTEVAAGVSAGGDVVHPAPMLSLAKVTERAELEAFLTRIAGEETVTEVKLDGMAVRIEYIDGLLKQVATRGDGVTGEDVTRQAAGVIAGLPARLPEPLTLEVRGEVFMTDADFAIASANRVKAGKAPFVNPRNATAGTLRNEDLMYVAPLSFAAYEATGNPVNMLPTHAERMTFLAQVGVTTSMSLIADINPIGDAHDVIALIGERRQTLGFPIDGAVVKVNDIAARDRFGVVSRAPKWAVAWKYPADAAQSVLRDIEVTIGRTGRMALTAIIDPVFVAGATVSRATLHNVDFVRAQGLGIGSKVAVVRANDVIPRVTALLGEQEEVETWEAPAACPNCDSEWDTSGVLWRCHSAECSAAAALAYWASRDCMDIERLGETICDALVESGLASNVADLYDLTIEDFAALPLGDRLLGEANAREIVAGLERSKAQPLNRVITGLGVRMTGRSVGRWLAAEFHTMAALRTATVEEIAAIDRLGPVKAQSIVDGLVALAPVIDRLAASGVNMGSEPSAEEAPAKPLLGKKFVVSGSVPGYTRTTVQERITALGGEVSSSVSKTTTALITSETETSKAQKAAQLGIPVIDPVEFAGMIA